MRRVQRSSVTGSRTGYVGYLSVQARRPDGTRVAVDGEVFYAQKYWQPGQYWDWQDDLWDQLSARGIVEILPIQPDAPAPNEKENVANDHD